MKVIYLSIILILSFSCSETKYIKEIISKRNVSIVIRGQESSKQYLILVIPIEFELNLNESKIYSVTERYSKDSNYMTPDYPDIYDLNGNELMSTSKVIMGVWDKTKITDLAFIKEKIIKPKTKVNFTIGIFFDGTGNNRFNSEKNYYKNLYRLNKLSVKIPDEVEIKTIKGKIKIDNTSSYWNPYSNITLLHDLYEQKNVS